MKPTKFDEKELNVVATENVRGTDVAVYNTPVTRKEGVVSAFRDHKAWWMLLGNETKTFCPAIIPDNIARGFVLEGTDFPREQFGGKDMFGVEWVFVEVAGGSMVKPGKPLLEDANDWKEVVKFPDIDSWDWEGSAKTCKAFCEDDKAVTMWLLNGCWFERLISFMDFEGAAMALLDEDQEDALKELFHEMTNLYLRLIDKSCEYYDIDGFCIHDDWGSQMAPFFSEEAARNFFLPEMKRLVDHVHSKNKYIELHSCGHLVKRCNVFVEAGFDAWTPMPMNDTEWLYETYGDKICLGVLDTNPVDVNAPAEEQKAHARAFAEKYCAKGYPVSFSSYNRHAVSETFRSELYKASREHFAK